MAAVAPEVFHSADMKRIVKLKIRKIIQLSLMSTNRGSNHEPCMN